MKLVVKTLISHSDLFFLKKSHKIKGKKLELDSTTTKTTLLDEMVTVTEMITATEMTETETDMEILMTPTIQTGETMVGLDTRIIETKIDWI